MRGSNSSNGGWISTAQPGIYYRLDAKDRKVYGVDFRDADGVRRRTRVPGYDNLGEAKRFQAHLRGSKQPLKQTSEYFGSYARTYLENRTGVRDESRRIGIRQLRDHVPVWFKKRKLHEITARDVRTLLRELEAKGLAPSTVGSVRYGVVSTTLGQAVDDDLIAANPCQSLKRQRAQKRDRRVKPWQILQPEEIEKLLSAAEGEERLALEMLIFTGLRVSELGGLVWGDINLDKKLIHVVRQLGPNDDTREELKTEASLRDVYLSASLVEGLRIHRREAFARGQAGKEDFVFLTDGGRAWSRNRLWRLLASTCDEAGVRRVKPHWCRHTFASILLNDPNVDIYLVSSQLGHSQVSLTLDVYGHRYQRERKANVSRAALDAFSI